MLACTLVACAPATTLPQPFVPVEVHQGYCFVQTTYEQEGKLLDRDATLEQVGTNRAANEKLGTGNALAIGSWVAAIGGVGAWAVGEMGRHASPKMNEDTSTALIATGIGVMLAGFGLCIASDSVYASAVETYNAGLRPRYTREGNTGPDSGERAAGSEDDQSEGAPAAKPSTSPSAGE